MHMTNMVQHAAMAALATFSLSGCVASIGGSGSDRTAGAAPQPPAPIVCDAATAQSHIGHDATQAMGGAILKDSGARSFRWGPPGGAWTMDYREDRVNVRYNEAMTITEITCG